VTARAPTFADGVRAFLDGARLVRQPGLRRFVWAPAGVSLVVIAAGLYLAFGYVETLGSWLRDTLPDWLGFLSAVLVPLVYLLSVLVAGWLFAFVAVLVASPFLGDLSLAVERADGGSNPPDGPPWWAGIPGALAREGRKLAYHLPRLLGVFLLTLIPLLNAAAPLIWFGFGAWLVAVEFADFPAENRQRPFRDTLALLKAHRGAALGYGSITTAALAIPLVNFLFVPAAVAGGTLLWRRLQPDPSISRCTRSGSA
jgi:CysZ protein